MYITPNGVVALDEKERATIRDIERDIDRELDEWFDSLICAALTGEPANSELTGLSEY
jgi:hypothetical protein